MHDEKRLLVTEVTLAGPIEGSSKVGFRVPVHYHLEDGSVEDWGKNFRLKRDAKAFVARLPAAPKYETHIEYHEATEHFRAYKVESTLIGIGRPAPNPAGVL